MRAGRLGHQTREARSTARGGSWLAGDRLDRDHCTTSAQLLGPSERAKPTSRHSVASAGRETTPSHALEPMQWNPRVGFVLGPNTPSAHAPPHLAMLHSATLPATQPPSVGRSVPGSSPDLAPGISRLLGSGDGSSLSVPFSHDEEKQSAVKSPPPARQKTQWQPAKVAPDSLFFKSSCLSIPAATIAPPSDRGGPKSGARERRRALYPPSSPYCPPSRCSLEAWNGTHSRT